MHMIAKNRLYSAAKNFTHAHTHTRTHAHTHTHTNRTYSRMHTFAENRVHSTAKNLGISRVAVLFFRWYNCFKVSSTLLLYSNSSIQLTFVILVRAAFWWYNLFKVSSTLFEYNNSSTEMTFVILVWSCRLKQNSCCFSSQVAFLSKFTS